MVDVASGDETRAGAGAGAGGEPGQNPPARGPCARAYYYAAGSGRVPGRSPREARRNPDGKGTGQPYACPDILLVGRGPRGGVD